MHFLLFHSSVNRNKFIISYFSLRKFLLLSTQVVWLGSLLVFPGKQIITCSIQFFLTVRTDKSRTKFSDFFWKTHVNIYKQYHYITLSIWKIHTLSFSKTKRKSGKHRSRIKNELKFFKLIKTVRFH